MGVQKFDGIQEKIEGGKNSSLTTILSIWNCVMGSSLLSHGSYLHHKYFLRWKILNRNKVCHGRSKKLVSRKLYSSWFYVVSCVIILLIFALKLLKKHEENQKKLLVQDFPNFRLVIHYKHLCKNRNSDIEPYLANYQNQKVVKLLIMLDWWYSQCTHTFISAVCLQILFRLCVIIIWVHGVSVLLYLLLMSL